VEGTDRFVASRVSRAEAVAQQLELQVTAGRLQSGDRLGTKGELRGRFGVAMATVNEAIRLLEMRGYVEARPGPGGGVFVAAPSARLRLGRMVLGFQWEGTSVSERVEVREALEPLVCREAARGRRPGDVRSLQGILARMDRSTDRGAGYGRLHWSLHRRLARACRNRPLRSFYLLLLDVLEDALGPDEVGGVDRAESMAAHRQLVRAFELGDGADLEVAIERHAALTGGHPRQTAGHPQPEVATGPGEPGTPGVGPGAG
jgi:DNA-binding FadR family transcriptional regulator